MPLSSGPHVRSASIPPSASRWLPCTGLRSTRQFLCMHPLRRNDAELTRWPSSGAHGPIGGFIVSRGQRCVTVTASGRLRAGGNITCAARVGLAQRPDPPGLPRSGSSRTAEARGLRLTAKAAEGVGGEVCDVADIESCTLADLELMYVDALWSFYHPDTKGQFTLSDEDFDRLKDELNWQGSGFPTLHREEIEFVEASIAYARGQPVVSDEQYDVLKRSVRRRGEDRKDVTALLLYTKGVQLLEPDQYELLRDEMTKLGIEVGLKGATCTLSKTSEELKMDTESILRMYTGLGFAPTVIGFATTIILGLPFHGFHPTVTSQSAVVSIAIGVALTTILANYLELHNTEILIGDCPCCETPIKQLFAGNEKANSVDQKCPVCGTLSTMDRTTRKISLASGPDFISA